MNRNFLFDLDQTLMDFHASERKALGLVLEENGLPYSNEIYSAFKECNKRLWMELEKQTITRTELFTTRFNYIFEKCGASPAGLDPLKVNDGFIKTMSVNGVLLDGALDFIQKLRREIDGSKIYIISNGATINAKGRIASSGLGEFLDGVFVSEEMGVAKPAKEFFDIVLDSIKAPKESCIVIGDSLSSDMLGAKNYSLASVWFTPQGDVQSAMREYDIDYCANNYDELFDTLKKWASL